MQITLLKYTEWEQKQWKQRQIETIAWGKHWMKVETLWKE